MLSHDGICQFQQHQQQHHQLLACSRVSFLGCWLVCSTTNNSSTLKESILENGKEREETGNYLISKSKLVYYFIYKDSLSAEDFARLSRTIKQLN